MKFRCETINQHLITIMAAFLMLVSVLLVGCNGTSPSEPKASDYQAKINELEKQVAALQQQIADKKPQSQTLNKDIAEVVVLGINTDVNDKQTFRFRLTSGDIVEGEVSTTNGTGGFISSVNDPFGNILLQSKTYTHPYNITSVLGGSPNQINLVDSSQVYPWKFSFIASTTGDYTLHVSEDNMSGTVKPDAHLRVVVNP